MDTTQPPVTVIPTNPYECRDLAVWHANEAARLFAREHLGVGEAGRDCGPGCHVIAHHRQMALVCASLAKLFVDSRPAPTTGPGR